MKGWFLSIKNNLKHHFVRDVAVLQVGNAFGTFLSFASSLVMARVFMPQIYGQYILIFSLIGLVGLFMNWGEEVASTTLLAEAYNRRNRQEILSIIAYYFKLSILIFLTVGLLGFILAPLLAELLYHQSIIGYWSRVIYITNFLLVIYVFLLLIFQVIRQLVKFALLENFNRFLTSLAIIIAVLLGLGIWGAIYAQLIVAAIFFIIVYSWYQKLQQKDELLPTWSEILKETFKVKIKKYFKFGLQIAIDKNISNLRALTPTLLIGYLLISSEVAFYRIAFSYAALTNLLTAPIASLLNVQFPKTKVYGVESLKKRFIQTSVIGGVISIYATLFLVILAPFLVKLFYGFIYLPSISLIYILAFSFALSGFGLGNGSMFRTLKKMKVSIVINIIAVILSLPLAWFLIKSYGAIGAAWWLVIIDNLLRIIGYCYLLNYFHQRTSQAQISE